MTSLDRRTFLSISMATVAASVAGSISASAGNTWADQLVEAAKQQIGKTTIYDPAYVGLKYPMGDVPIERGVCSDVVIRAYRDAFGLDLQQLVHEDMKRHFNRYPKVWGVVAAGPEHRSPAGVEPQGVL